MDKFDEKLKIMMNLTENDRKKDLEEKKKSCICPGCPTYNDCAKKGAEALFCINEKSTGCIKKESGCLCPACKIYSSMSLSKTYYCIRGTEQESRVKNA